MSALVTVRGIAMILNKTNVNYDYCLYFMNMRKCKRVGRTHTHTQVIQRKTIRLGSTNGSLFMTLN